MFAARANGSACTVTCMPSSCRRRRASSMPHSSMPLSPTTSAGTASSAGNRPAWPHARPISAATCWPTARGDRRLRTAPARDDRCFPGAMPEAAGAAGRPVPAQRSATLSPARVGDPGRRTGIHRHPYPRGFVVVRCLLRRIARRDRRRRRQPCRVDRVRSSVSPACLRGQNMRCTVSGLVSARCCCSRRTCSIARCRTAVRGSASASRSTWRRFDSGVREA